MRFVISGGRHQHFTSLDHIRKKTYAVKRIQKVLHFKAAVNCWVFSIEIHYEDVKLVWWFDALTKKITLQTISIQIELASHFLSHKWNKSAGNRERGAVVEIATLFAWLTAKK